MHTFLLLHGSWHAAWNWHRFIPELEARGHRGIALDLPGHGRDGTPASRVTLERCVDHVANELQRLDGPAVLLAHSRNGIVISQLAERLPERVSALVYLAAYLVPNGKSMMDYAQRDADSLVVQNLVPAMSLSRMTTLTRWLRHRWLRGLARALLPESLQTHRLDPRVFREALYHDCDPAFTEMAHALLQPEPHWPGFTPLQLSEARYGRVPRAYIRLSGDRAVTPSLQDRMLAAHPCHVVRSLPGGHSPFFADPSGLRDVVLQALSELAAATRDAASNRENGSLPARGQVCMAKATANG